MYDRLLSRGGGVHVVEGTFTACGLPATDLYLKENGAVQLATSMAVVAGDVTCPRCRKHVK